MNDADSLSKPDQEANLYLINIETNVNEKEQKITFIPDDKTLLNRLEKNNIDVHYHCRDGFCGACRVTLAKGTISYPNGEPLAFVGENEILPCCCIPTSNITLKIE